MTQLIYVSTAIRGLGDADLKAILDASLRHNLRQEVTGVLLYGNGCFMQVLEGELEAINETMARIESDARHHGIVVLGTKPIPAREFGNWTMSFKQLSNWEMESQRCTPFSQYGGAEANKAEELAGARVLLRLFASTNC